MLTRIKTVKRNTVNKKAVTIIPETIIRIVIGAFLVIFAVGLFTNCLSLEDYSLLTYNNILKKSGELSNGESIQISLIMNNNDVLLFFGKGETETNTIYATEEYSMSGQQKY